MNITEEQEEIKKEFQLERVILFSDAVFAIIITIMVIDLKLPESIRNSDAEHLKEGFRELIPKFLAYMLSFFLVSIFWIRHLKIFSFLRDYNLPLLGLNLFFLFCVSMFPFAVTLVSGGIHLKSLFYGWGVNFYLGIILLTLFSQTLLTWYLFQNRASLCIRNNEMDAMLQWKVNRFNLFLIPLIAIFIAVLNYFNINPYFAMYSMALLGVSRSILTKIYYPHAAESQSMIFKIFNGRKKPELKAKRAPVEEQE